jgi:hypothetical protein
MKRNLLFTCNVYQTLITFPSDDLCFARQLTSPLYPIVPLAYIPLPSSQVEDNKSTLSAVFPIDTYTIPRRYLCDTCVMLP